MKNIKIAIGYSWSGTVHRDSRWKDLRDFCVRAADYGLKQAAASFRKQVSTDDDKENTIPRSFPRVDVARLRASAGQFVWPSISRRIDAADILIFDITAAEDTTTGKAQRSANVWLELGYALAQSSRDGKAVFVVHAEHDGHKEIASDLQGLMVGHAPKDGALNKDQSLRFAVAGQVKRLALAALNGLQEDLLHHAPVQPFERQRERSTSGRSRAHTRTAP
jgi:hypothetical protein